jgi:serine/threonine protein kinase
LRSIGLLDSRQQPNMKSLRTLVMEGVTGPSNENTIKLMREHFADRCMLALNEQDIAQTAEIYRLAANLPRSKTKSRLRERDISLGGLVGSSGQYHAGFEGTIPLFLKAVTDAQERERLEALQLHQLNALNIPHLVRCKVVDRNSSRTLVATPRYPAVLLQHPRLDHNAASALLRQMSAALEGLHAVHIAHMDVKPSNIAITTEGNFVLIDMGSAAHFGPAAASAETRVPTTARYLPLECEEYDDPKPDPELDWWMLATMLVEKTQPFPHTAARHTKNSILTHLRAILQPDEFGSLAALFKETEDGANGRIA